jgi:Arc/MetJ-type ribon-helix-helix transcriptional regulator
MGLRDADTEKITLRLPARYLKALDFLVQVDDFPSRSEAVRAAIRDFVYARVELVTEKLKKMQDAERTLAEAESFKREYMNK